MLKARQPAPADYYADRFGSMLRDVASQYSDILSPEESAFIQTQQRLSVGAQRLYARLVTRKGLLFRVDSLKYREIANLSACLCELVSNGFLQFLHHCAADKLLNLVTKAELLNLFPLTPPRHKKPECIDFITTRYTDHAIRSRLETPYPWVVRCDSELLKNVEMLFFGTASRNFSVFVLEDLGIQTFENYKLDKQSRIFNSRKEFVDYLKLLECSICIELLTRRWDQLLAGELHKFLHKRFDHRLLERVRRKYLFKLSREAERQGKMEFALEGYKNASIAPSTERQIRIQLKIGNIQASHALLLKMLTAESYTASEKMFASRFAHRNNKRWTGSALNPLPTVFETETDANNGELRQTTLVLPEPPIGHIEDAVVDWYHQKGYRAWHTENGFIQAIFGLAFWHVIFAPVPGVFVNRYQSGPLDLYWPDFFEQRKNLVKTRLAELSGTGFRAELLSIYDEKWGVANTFVGWRLFERSVLEDWLETIPQTYLLKLLKVMVSNIQQYRRGFPDLLVIDRMGCVEFVEVKGPGDQLSSHQRVWFNLFYKLEVPARVLRVSW